MWSILLASWTTMCGAIGVAYVDISAFASLLYTDISSLFAATNNALLFGGTSIQTFGAAALKSFGGL